jgi:anaerobic selenocysteine-containing dehydrogenase
MTINRRQFLKWAGLSTASAVVLNACGIPERELEIQSPLRLPEDLVKGIDNWYATQCGHCSGGCGVVVRVVEGRAKKIEGNLDYPVNRGRHSARCEAGLQALYHPDRIKAPLRRTGDRGSGQFQEIGWQEALRDLTTRLGNIRRSGQADSVVIATEPLRGHLGMVVNRFVESYGATYLRYEPMDIVVLRRAMKKVFNQDRLPDLDLDHANFLLSFGADFLGTWVSPVRFSRGYGEFRQGKERHHRGYFVQVEPRLSHTGANADDWIPVAPGMEGALAMSLAYVIIDENVDGLGETDAARSLTGGKGSAALTQYAPENIVSTLGIPTLRGIDPASKIRALARRFAQERPSLAIGGGSAAAHTNGLDNLVAIYSLNYLVGSVNTKGGVIFNPPSPIPGVPDSSSGSTLTEWESVVTRLRKGTPKPVNLILARGVDPIYSLPSITGFKEALGDTFLVTISNFMDETTLNADLILPEEMYLEAWGDDIPDPGPGYLAFGVQQPVVKPQPGLDLNGGFGDILLTLANGIGGDVKQPWNSFKDVLFEGYEALYEVPGGSIKSGTYEGFWTGILQRGGWWNVNHQNTTAASKPKILKTLAEAKFYPPHATDSYFLLPFNSLGIDDGRYAHLPWLQAMPDPISTAVWSTWVEINSKSAEELGLREGDIVELVVDNRRIEVLIDPNPAVPPMTLLVPMGGGHTNYGRYSKGRGSNVLGILAPLKDTGTDSLAWAATKVKLVKTNRHVSMPRFEGDVPSVETEPGRIIKLTRPEH